MERELKMGDQAVVYDRELTVAAYQNVAQGGATTCACDSCRNFSAQRSSVYPPKFLELLGQLGIDPNKEGEAYELGPDPDGLRNYGGWLYFVGRMAVPGESLVELENFKYFFGTSFPKPHAAFTAHPVLAVEFYTKLPWVLE
jgi:hypothetical protein